MRWSVNEEEILFTNFNKCSYKELSEMVSRSEGSVKGKLERMHLIHKKVSKWNADEDEYMLSNYGILPPREIASVLDRTIGSINARAVFLGITNKYSHKDFVPNYNINFFREWSEDLAWLVGIVLSDGHVSNPKLSSKYIRIKMCDSDVIYKIRDMIDFQGNIGVFIPTKGHKTSYSITVSGKEVWNFFVNLGMNSDKSHTAIFPQNVPKEYIHHLIRGIFDGDGSITIIKEKYISCRICGTEKVVNSIRNFLDIHSTIHSNSTVNFIVQYTGDRAVKFMEYIYKGASESNRMDRKYNIYKGFIN